MRAIIVTSLRDLVVTRACAVRARASRLGMDVGAPSPRFATLRAFFDPLAASEGRAKRGT